MNGVACVQKVNLNVTHGMVNRNKLVKDDEQLNEM